MISTLFLEILVEKVDEHSVPSEEEAIKMDNPSLIDVYNGPIAESVDGARIFLLIELRRLRTQTVDSVGEGFSIRWRHGVEVIAHRCVFGGACLRLRGLC